MRVLTLVDGKGLVVPKGAQMPLCILTMKQAAYRDQLLAVYERDRKALSADERARLGILCRQSPPPICDDYPDL